MQWKRVEKAFHWAALIFKIPNFATSIPVNTVLSLFFLFPTFLTFQILYTRDMSKLYSAGVARGFRLGREGPGSIGVVFSDIDLVCITAGERCGIAVHADGSVSFWGQNADFEIGLGPTRQIEPITTFTPREVGFCATWVSSYGRRTAYVSSTGDLYIASSEFRSTGAMLRIVSPCPVVTCVSGPTETYAIDLNGRIASFTTVPNGSFTLRGGSAVSVAAGDRFAIAVCTAGLCYGCGRLTGTATFVSITSLESVTAATVYAYGDWAIVLTAKGRIYKATVTDANARPQFLSLAFPSGVVIIDVSVSDKGALFVAEGGTVYAMGDNQSGRFFCEGGPFAAPTPVPSLSGIVCVALAMNHALAYAGPRRALR
jgi:hypothetical protein